MLCSYCGKENKNSAKYCDGCGKEIVGAKMQKDADAQNIITQQKEKDWISENAETPAVQKGNNRKLLVLIAIVAVLMLVAVVFLVVISKSPQKKYEEQLKLAERYLGELDYDRAIAAYRAALEIDPKGKEAYLGLADAYVGKGDLQAAIDILTEGLKKTESEAMEARLEELKKQLAEEKADELRALAEPTLEPEKPKGKGKTNWRGGAWTNRDDVMPYMNDEGYMVFGAYEQDGDESNGPEPIEWEVLARNGNGTFLVSRYVLDTQPYNTELADVTWESCTLRSWLNGEFLNKTFTRAEQAVIHITDVTNPDNPYGKGQGGSNTKDSIFLLSVDEVLSNFDFNSPYEVEFEADGGYFIKDEGYSMDLIILPTAYAKQQGTYSFVITEDYYNGYVKEDGNVWEGLKAKNYSRNCIGREGAAWWLRSPSDGNDTACCVGASGNASWGGYNYVDFGSMGILPALYISE